MDRRPGTPGVGRCRDTARGRTDASLERCSGNPFGRLACVNILALADARRGVVDRADNCVCNTLEGVSEISCSSRTGSYLVMNWLILIVAGFCEVSFIYCLGRVKSVEGLAWWAGLPDSLCL